MINSLGLFGIEIPFVAPTLVPLFLVYLVVILVILVLLRGEFWRKLWYLIATPTHQLKTSGDPNSPDRDGLFFTLMLMFLSAVMCSLFLLITHPWKGETTEAASRKGYEQGISRMVGLLVSPTTANADYRKARLESASSNAASLIELNLWQSSFMWGIVWVGFVIVTTFVMWLFMKLFGHQNGYGDLLRPMAYIMFLGSVTSLFTWNMLTAYLSGNAGNFMIYSVVAGIFGLYTLILFFIALGSSTEISPVVIFFAVLIVLLLLGGGGYLGFTKKLQPALTNWASEWSNWSPEKGTM